MRLTVGSAALLERINRVASIVPARSVIPIMKSLLFDVTQGRLTLTASTLEVSTQVTMQVDSSDSIRIAIDHKVIVDILKVLTDQPVTFTIDPSCWGVSMVASSGTYTFVGESADGFPKIPVDSDAVVAHIDAAALLKAFNRTSFAIHPDVDKGVLNGLNIAFGQQGITFAATDASRLVRYRIFGTEPAPSASIVIPRIAIGAVKSAFAPGSGVIRISHNGSNAFFRSDDTLVACRLIDQRYPEYKYVIPNDATGRITVGRQAMRGSLSRVSVFANKTSRLTRLSVAGSRIMVSSQDFDYSRTAEEEVPCDLDGTGMDIGFNSSLLLDALNNLHTEEVIIRLSAPNRAIIVLPSVQEPGEDILMLVMPMMLHDYTAQ